MIVPMTLKRNRVDQGKGEEKEELPASKFLITKEKPVPTTNNDRVYTCKTCDKVFSTFQALGGHRASHTTHNMKVVDPALGNMTKKLHECHVCGEKFDLGQALGGHMTKHRNQTKETTKTSENSSSSKEELSCVSTSHESRLFTVILFPMVPAWFSAKPVEIVRTPETYDSGLDLDLKL